MSVTSASAGRLRQMGVCVCQLHRLRLVDCGRCVCVYVPGVSYIDFFSSMIVGVRHS